MASKRKYTVLSTKQRLDVLKDLQEKSLSVAQISVKYDVHIKTIRNIKKNAAKISTFSSKTKREQKLRRTRKPIYDKLDTCLLAWFAQKRSCDDCVTDSLMLKKAKEIKQKLPSCSQIKVNRGWLSKFKRRHGIRLLHTCKNVANDDVNAADVFTMTFRKILRDQNVSLESVYNMEESGLVWKALPKKTLTGEEELNLSGYKTQKDRLTIGLCANALGTHKIMPLLIHKYKNPRALKHEVSLPVIFKSKANVLMDSELFLDWYENHFKPSVRKYRDSKQISGKVILLLDNRECHQISPLKDDDFKIVYLPPNTAPLIQPMSQGIIRTVKRLFRHELLQRFLTYAGGVDEFYKDYTLKTFIEILVKSWSEVTESNIRNAWQEIVTFDSSPQESLINQMELDWQDTMSKVTGEKCTPTHDNEFLTHCKEEEMIIEDEIHGETREEPEHEPQEITYDGTNEETVRNDLIHIFDKLTSYSRQAPVWIQCIVKGLKMFFLGKKH